MSGSSFLLMMLLYLWQMLLLVVGWITATQFSGASPSSIYISCSASKIVQPKSPVFKKFHCHPVEQRTVFKTATLVYKFLHTGFPQYFAPYLCSHSSSYSTRCSQSGGNFLVIPKFKIVIKEQMNEPRLASSLCISYSTISDIHGIIMNPYNTQTYLKCKDLSQPGEFSL